MFRDSQAWVREKEMPIVPYVLELQYLGQISGDAQPGRQH
jgi:hypothetical protein